MKFKYYYYTNALNFALLMVRVNSSIAVLLHSWRVEHKLNQQEVSEHLSISQSAYSQLENGNRGLTLQDAYKLCKLYKKRLYELFPEHKVELVESELRLVHEHERTSTLAAFKSEIASLRKQNMYLEELLNSTLSLHHELSKVLKNKMGIK